ncbi:hypothetical protein OAF43_01280 [bacterium]|nr:hypothetical protein [bacterium]
MMSNDCTKLKTLALRLGITRQTLRKYCEKGFVPSAYKTKNGTWKIPALDMAALEELVGHIQNEVAKTRNETSPTCRRPNGIKSATAARLKKLGVKNPSEIQLEDVEKGVLACLYQCAKWQIIITDKNIAQIRSFLLGQISRGSSLNKSVNELRQNTNLSKFKPEQRVLVIIKQIAEGMGIETARFTVAKALNLNRYLYSEGEKIAGTIKIWGIINDVKPVKWANKLDGEESYSDCVEAYTATESENAFEDTQTGFEMDDDRFVPEIRYYSEATYYHKTKRVEKKSVRIGVFSGFGKLPNVKLRKQTKSPESRKPTY